MAECQLGVLGMVELHAIAAFFLGHVACGIAGGQDLGQRQRAVGHVDEADGNTDGECALVHDEVELRYRLAQRFCDAHRVLDGAVLHQHAELVAAQPRQRVAFAQPLLQHDADLAHELVARGVPARVVDDLELVEIEIHHRVMAALFARAGQRAVQPVLELAPVDEAGQRVVRCLV